MVTKIVIIKLGAKGDVVRTLSLIPGVKEKYPDSEIYWITRENISDLFKNNPYIKGVFYLPYANKQSFDLLINLDTDKGACELASSIDAKKKLGFYFSHGFPAAFNLGAEYYLNTIFDDELKKYNKKTYQEMIFEASELNWKKQLGEIYLNREEKDFSKEFILKNNLQNRRIIGIHIGAGKRWPSKAWHKEELIRFIKLAKSKSYELILFCGPEEIEEHRNIIKYLERENIRIYQNNPKNTNREFFSLINVCNIMVCGDSFALHVSLALKKPTIGLFFCTSPAEIEDYGMLKKIVSTMLDNFFPERMNEYNKELTKSIKAEQVLDEVNKVLR